MAHMSTRTYYIPIIRRVSSKLATLSLAHTHMRTWSTLTRTSDALTVHALNDTSFQYIWLRDSCQSPLSVHPSTKQKLHQTSDIALDVAPIQGEDGVKVIPSGLEVKWDDGQTSIYSKAWLERHASPDGVDKLHMDGELREEAWTRESVSGLPGLFIPYEEIHTPEGLVKGITQLARYGLLFVRGVPNRETSEERCELRVLAERFGELRRTFYGLLWDVINVKDSKNIAYTNLMLGLHMDLLYFEHPPRYQILHCLRNQVVGGKSVFVDGLQAARKLRKTHPADFDILTKTPVSFHYINDGHHLHKDHPTIELASSSSDISHINYSPPFQAPLRLNTPKAFYPALKQFSNLLNDPENTYEYTLNEGDAVLFDNRRVLHARTAFHEREDVVETTMMKQREPNRWLKGCYLEADALMDRVRVLKTKLSKGDLDAA